MPSGAAAGTLPLEDPVEPPPPPSTGPPNTPEPPPHEIVAQLATTQSLAQRNTSPSPRFDIMVRHYARGANDRCSSKLRIHTRACHPAAVDGVFGGVIPALHGLNEVGIARLYPEVRTLRHTEIICGGRKIASREGHSLLGRWNRAGRVKNLGSCCPIPANETCDSDGCFRLYDLPFLDGVDCPDTLSTS